MTERARWFYRFITANDWKLALISVIAVAALFGAVSSLYWLSDIQDQREQDRIESDIEGCERGNRLRALLKDLGEADETLIREVIRELGEFAELTPEEFARLNASLDPLFEDHSQLVRLFVEVDCQSVTIGAENAIVPSSAS